MTPKAAHFGIIFSVTFLTLVAFQNCVEKDHVGQMLTNSQRSVGYPSSSVPTTTLPSESPSTTLPAADNSKGLPFNYDSGCLQNTQFDVCLFYKNPVSQEQQAFDPPTTLNSDLSEYQVHGGLLRNLGNTGYLENRSIIVGANFVSDNSHQLERPTVSYIRNNAITYGQDPDRFYAQVNAYYWLTEQENYMVTQTGAFYASDRGTFVDAANFQFTSSRNNAFYSILSLLNGSASA